MNVVMGVDEFIWVELGVYVMVSCWSYVVNV